MLNGKVPWNTVVQAPLHSRPPIFPKARSHGSDGPSNVQRTAQAGEAINDMFFEAVKNACI